MIYDLPLSVEICGETYKIRNGCDYRVILDCIEALNDEDLDMQYRIYCALYIFYEDLMEKGTLTAEQYEEATRQMFVVINYGEEDNTPSNKPKLMDWSHDFKIIAPAVSRILGYDIRTPDRYCHFWTFIGAYMEIGECQFQTIVSIRSKRAKGKKLENWEQEFYRENRKLIDLPHKLTAEEEEFLDSDW